jgi:hypothetical protein
MPDRSRTVNTSGPSGVRASSCSNILGWRTVRTSAVNLIIPARVEQPALLRRDLQAELGTFDPRDTGAVNRS